MSFSKIFLEFFHYCRIFKTFLKYQHFISKFLGFSLMQNIHPCSKQKNSSRRNAWGNQSYADLITQAIKSSPEQRLTLSQIYDWVVKNVPYFKDKGDSASSSGWKVNFFFFSNVCFVSFDLGSQITYYISTY